MEQKIKCREFWIPDQRYPGEWMCVVFTEDLELVSAQRSPYKDGQRPFVEFTPRSDLEKFFHIGPS